MGKKEVVSNQKKIFTNLLEKLKNKEKIEFIYVKCPFLKGMKCTIYKRRMKCCKAFPNKDGICSEYECKLKDNKSSYEICKKCRNPCCKRIFYPKDIKFNINLFKDLMNLDCKTCSKIFKGYSWD